MPIEINGAHASGATHAVIEAAQAAYSASATPKAPTPNRLFNMIERRTNCAGA
ncbi:hypothetical protein [Rhodococcus sp. KBW08]|uniref:hypothetical protein n=1 Tax=Rhodococcus sp. KBW08 TaxID=2144188 RepID=UPI001C8A3E15|nr:hypothetical protein [Rhodococcus sp. KBW08]